jgi:hypothetical protein
MSDLAGDLTVSISDQHADAFTRNEFVVVVKQDLGVVKYGAWTYATPEMLADAAVANAVIGRAIDRWLRPWTQPDRKGWPARIDLFPRAAALARRLRAAVARFRRDNEGDDW